MVIGKSEGKGVSKAKLLKRKYEAKLKIPGGGVGKISTEEPSLEEVWIFSETTHFKKYLQLNSENCECLKYCRIVDCLVTNHKKVQDMQANLKTTN